MRSRGGPVRAKVDTDHIALGLQLRLELELRELLWSLPKLQPEQMASGAFTVRGGGIINHTIQRNMSEENDTHDRDTEHSDMIMVRCSRVIRLSYKTTHLRISGTPSHVMRCVPIGVFPF